MVDGDLLVEMSDVCDVVAETFQRACRVAPSIAVSEEAFDERRRQYSAATILRNIVLPEGVEHALGVVDVDLFVPELNFVFGLAQGNRAVIALPRLRAGAFGQAADSSLFRQRVAKEAVHELGHSYGLGHCPNRHCVMAFSNSLNDTDVKSRELCPICRERLGLPQR
jgi:archaemetzincin